VTDSGECYAAGVFYCKDAFEGLAIMDALADVQQRGSLMERIWRESDFEQNKAAGTSGAAAPGLRSDVTAAAFIPRPVVWGPRVVHSMPLEAVWQYLSLNELFRLSWGAKNTHGEAWEKLKAGFSERLGSMQRAALTDGWLQPRGMYGCWPAQSDGNDLVLYEPGTLEADSPVELTRFRFPRQTGGENLCLADYFAPQGSGQMDVVAFQVVTVGQQASERFDRLQEAGDYTEAYFTHGLAVQTAEAAAEYLHRHIRRELGLADDQGKRYSWGYPAIPDLEDHQKVFELLPAQSELGMVLTTAYQLVPEQSTAAIIVHHPQAKYYQTGESRIDQLTRA
jgi:5-methyltetrahydrofolate--homocysteine methyltransferase